jgi:hypothetical protein
VAGEKPFLDVVADQRGYQTNRAATPYSVLAQGWSGAVRTLLPHLEDAPTRFMKAAPRLASC